MELKLSWFIFLLWFDLKAENYANSGIRQPRWRQKPRPKKMEMFYHLAGCRCKFPRDQGTFLEWTKVSEEFEKVLDGTSE